MSPDQFLLIVIIFATFLGFALEWLPIDAVALTCLAALLVFDLISAEEAISGFSNPAVITVMMMFILSYGLTRTGLIAQFAHRVAQWSGRSRTRGVNLLLSTSGLLSAFINNTAAVAILMPVAMQLAKRFKFSPSKILMPLSYVGIIGGTCTLIGTSTNLLVASIAEKHGLAPLGVFEFSALGLVLVVVGMAYILLGPVRHLPERSDTTSLTSKYKMDAYLTELRVTRGSPLIGHNVLEEHISERFGLNVLEVLRGEERIAVNLRAVMLQLGDLIIVRGAMEDILAFREQYALHLLTDVKLTDEDLSDQNNILVEVQITPFSQMIDQTLKEIDFRRVYGCFVLALNRTGEAIRDRLADIPFKQWDTVLIFGPRNRIEALYNHEDFIPLQELEFKLRLPKRWWLSVSIIPLVVLLAAAGAMSILKASILGAVAMLVTRSLTIQQAYKSINWTVIFLLASILPLGIAMENTGLADSIGHEVAVIAGNHGDLVALSVIYLVTALLSEIVSNNSTAVLMVPISMTVARELGLDPKPFVMAVAFAASSSFMTPMGYQTNAMVMGPGGYKFGDFVRAGAPLKLIFWLISTLAIPLIWPLR